MRKHKRTRFCSVEQIGLAEGHKEKEVEGQRPLDRMEVIKRLREEGFVKSTEDKLLNHAYIKAAEKGELSLAQKQSFAREQYHIQLSDAISFATLSGHGGFAPDTLTNAEVPEAAPGKQDDLFQFLLGGEVYASSLLLKYAKSLGLDEDQLKSSRTFARAQAYPSYWARLALSKKRAAGAAACAVNFPAWGRMCGRLLQALGEKDQMYSGVEDESLAFINFLRPLSTVWMRWQRR